MHLELLFASPATSTFASIQASDEQMFVLEKHNANNYLDLVHGKEQPDGVPSSSIYIQQQEMEQQVEIPPHSPLSSPQIFQNHLDLEQLIDCLP